MVLGVMEGQSRGGYFPDCILDPSVIDCSVHRCPVILGSGQRMGHTLLDGLLLTISAKEEEEKDETLVKT